MKKIESIQKAYNEDVMLVGKNIERIRMLRGLNPIKCFTCTECSCCEANKNLYISDNESKILKKLITPKHIVQAKAAKNEKAIKGMYRCPFLIDSRCSVYEVRPLVCSSYLVIDEPDTDCSIPKGAVSYLDSGRIIAGAVSEEGLRGDYGTIVKLTDLLDIF